ncbi:prosaposin isoform X2 [Calliopsis andreniformis]|uniref:prosaposin isoform X2 n=1 Tax=Calliopsis andreniformis TaxID=337506 RepID=UPI003FCE4DF0
MRALIVLCAILAVSTAQVVVNDVVPSPILGRNRCTWGPSFWCANIQNSAKCNTTKACINISWKNMQVPEDNDSVCKVCKDMVQQARDQLRSNETEQDLKNVFEGSCKLIHVQPIVKECITIVDQYIPELVETVASQMNPSVVCTVAGLCNSAHIDKLLAENGQSTSKNYELKAVSLAKDELEPDECSKCFTVATHMEIKFNATPRNELLQQLLNLCSDLGTFSDACAAVTLTYFDTIQGHLKENFKAKNICHLSGQCSGKFHVHEDADTGLNVQIEPLSTVGVVDMNDDLPCKLCEQLVGHLRDLLVANTTETEFEQVLDGLCKQTKSFVNECTSIVDEYYPQIYEYLTKGLNGNAVCKMAGLCPAPGKRLQDQQIRPLLPSNIAETGMRLFQEAKKNLENEKHKDSSQSEVEAMQLPIERLVPFPLSEDGIGVRGKESCALCEYVLHYIQDAVTNPTAEDKVKQVLEKVCKKLPESIEGECSEFIDSYGDAIIALLVQEIDPSQVCPMLHLCPSQRLMQLWESVPTKYMLESKEEKPSCPLCLLAVTQVYDVIKNNKTEANIQAELDKLCTHLPRSLKDQCINLVDDYSKQIIELLLADLKPSEVCAFLKLCDATQNPGPSKIFNTKADEEILTNEIPNSIEHVKESRVNPKFLDDVCEWAVEAVLKRVGTDKNKQRVENEVHHVCGHLSKGVSRECNKLVNKYGDRLIDFILEDFGPSAACAAVGLRSLPEALVASDQEKSEESRISLNPLEDVCEEALKLVLKRVGTSKNKQRIENEVHHVCGHLPKGVSRACNNLVNKYGDRLIDFILEDFGPSAACAAVGLRSLPEALVASDQEKSEESRISLNPLEDVCEEALKLVLKRVGTSKNKQRIENEVHHVCGHLPKGVSRECNKLVNKYGDRLIDFVLQDVAPATACLIVGLRDLPEDSVPLEQASETECSLCEYALHYVQVVAPDHITKDEATKAIGNVCSKLPESMGDICSEFVARHGNAIASKLVQAIKPNQVCPVLRLCPSKGLVEVEETVPKAHRPETRIDKPSCPFCKMAVKKLYNIINNDKTEKNIEAKLDKLCNYLPNSMTDQCKDLVKGYSKEIIDLVLADLTPDEVCTYLEFCDAKQNLIQTSISSLNQVDELFTNEVLGSVESVEKLRVNPKFLDDVCEWAVEAVLKRVGTDKNKQRVENEVHHVCGHLSKGVSRECNKLVNKYGDRLIDFILEDFGPSAACAAVGLRSLPEDLVASYPGNSEKSRLGLNFLEDVCEEVVKVVDKQVGTNRNKQRVENAVNGVCNDVPELLFGDCNKLVNEYGDKLINSILSSTIPSIACSAIGLFDFPEDLIPAYKASATECAVCKSLISAIEELLADEHVDNGIKHVVAKACKYVPGKYGKKCVSLVNSYGQSIINLIEAHNDTKKICSRISLCTARDYSMVSLENSRRKRSYEKDPTKRCTWGPAYWCSTNATAVECKAVEHCRENVWRADFAPPKNNA